MGRNDFKPDKVQSSTTEYSNTFVHLTLIYGKKWFVDDC
ncbi:hypothetical protein T4B_4511 [Trichinella pseudospiralis]|uniref:Uncharacterized protein n=1 Tax=Trichinella pseudospiralis TaxID=6337 RepID=A0A0V1GFQ3_TRIPS|nr:hypothetical protein T4B_4511 [Trichinella pseudospiralis]KRY97983.1 hypothetical protein T4C_13047 [Trichinella pseudospiralis]